MSGRGVAFLSLLLVVAVAAMLTARELSVGHDEAAAADTAAAAGDWYAAISHARAAAEARVPGSPWPARGLACLEAIGHDAEVRADDDTALLAYGALRTASIETRSAFSSDPWRRARGVADNGLARVAASHEADGAGRRAAASSMLEALRSETGSAGEGTGPWTAVLLAVSSIAMVGGTARLAAGFEGAGALRFARAALLAGLVGYTVVMMAH